MRRILATLAVVGALLFSAGSAWADYDDRLATYQRADYTTALQEWRPLAEQDDVKALNLIRAMYNAGTDVPKNYAKVVK